MTKHEDPVGLYVHVPYCRALCHYCDFAKTANFGGEHTGRYLAALASHLDAWLAWPGLAGRPVGSVFFGGGTPSLFTRELEPLFARFRSRLAPGAEITLEANPDDVTDESLAAWKELGVTRLSLGVQSFDHAGLTFLTRTHSGTSARAALVRARRVFADVNADLIYGWPGQTETSWTNDLSAAVGSGANHLSLYTLTYESRTPIGRAALRGKIVPPPDKELARAYEEARATLEREGFAHDEVSNWARPGHTCRHNWLYWQDREFVGIGAGAHGYLRDPGDPGGIGVRYAYDRSDRKFAHAGAPAPGASVAEVARALGAIVDERTADDWLTEYVGSSLRTERGTDLARIAARAGRTFEPTPIVARGLAEGALTRLSSGSGASATDVLLLSKREWFRETSWSVEVLRSCRNS